MRLVKICGNKFLIRTERKFRVFCVTGSFFVASTEEQRDTIERTVKEYYLTTDRIPYWEVGESEFTLLSQVSKIPQCLSPPPTKCVYICSCRIVGSNEKVFVVLRRLGYRGLFKIKSDLYEII